MQQDADVETQISSKKKKSKHHGALNSCNSTGKSILCFNPTLLRAEEIQPSPLPRTANPSPHYPKTSARKKKVRSPRRGSPRRNRRDVQQPAETHAAQRGRRRQNSKHAPPPPTPGERGNAPLVLEGDEREALRLHLLPPPAAAADGGGGGGVGSVTRERECVCPYGGEEEMWGTRGRPRPKQTDQRPSRNEHVSWVSSLRCLTREEDGMGFGLRRRKASSTGLRDSCDLCPPRPTRRERERGRPRSPISSVRRARERSVARGAPPRVFLRCGWAMAISLDLLQ